MSILDFDARDFSARLDNTTLAAWGEALANAVLEQGHALKHGHLPRWENAIQNLPRVENCDWSIRGGSLCINGTFSEEQSATLTQCLNDLIPWRKGPFTIGPVTIDTEWRSDWKWARIARHIQPLQEKTVLDVGCGSGYHLWCMRAAGAQQVLGIDPSLLYLKQFNAIQRYACDPGVHFLPLPMEALPSQMQVFDTVFSMGVLYHRRDPMPHLQELQQALKPGGELVLETLVIPDSEDTSLMISERYANMRNIYELPSIKRLESWIASAGYQHVRTISVQTTSRHEQHSTGWMPSHSLEQALDPHDLTRTVEGYPRPLRAVTLARKR